MIPNTNTIRSNILKTWLAIHVRFLPTPPVRPKLQIRIWTTVPTIVNILAVQTVIIDFVVEQELQNLFKPKQRPPKTYKLFTPYDKYGNKTYIHFYDSDDSEASDDSESVFDDDDVPSLVYPDDSSDDETETEYDPEISNVAEEVPECGGSSTQFMFYRQSDCETSSSEGASIHSEGANQQDMDIDAVSNASPSDGIDDVLSCSFSSESSTDESTLDVDTAEYEYEHACKAAESSSIKRNKLQDPNIFVADTGATCHIKVNTQGMTNLRRVNKSVRMGQSSVKILFQGDYECKARQIDGTIRKVILRDVRVAPGAGCNLLSLTRLLDLGYKLHGDKQGLRVSRGKLGIMFDHVIEAGSGRLLGVQLVPTSHGDVAAFTLQEGS